MKPRAEYRKEWVLVGKCANCGAMRPADDWNSLLCANCRENEIERKRRRREELKAAHRCSHCGKAMPSGWRRAKCQPCVATAAAGRGRRRAERHAAGLCGECGIQAEPGRKLCRAHAEVCREKAKRLAARRVASGRCRDCGAVEPRPGKLTCAECAAETRSGDLLRQRERRKAGLCLHCGCRPAQSGLSSCAGCRASINEKRQRIRDVAFAKYGGAECSCCGERHREFLQIDHVDNDGARHRRRDPSANGIYAWLKANKYPPGFQVLCANCNLAKAHYGVCPHQRGRHVSEAGGSSGGCPVTSR